MPVMLGAAAIGAAGGIASGLIGANAAKDAANIQAQSAANALAFQNNVFDWQKQQYANASDYIKNQYANGADYIKQAYQPYMQAGAQATNTLSRLTGGGTNTPDYSSFFNSPDYNFALQQGMRGLTNYENAQGMGMSGGALRDVATFNQGLATQQYGNYFNRLMQLSQLGSGAAGGAAGGIGTLTGASMSGIGSLTGGAMNTAGSMASTIGNTTQGIGQAQASGVVGGANAITGGINSGVNNSLLSAALFSNPSAYKNLNDNLTKGFSSFLPGS